MAKKSIDDLLVDALFEENFKKPQEPSLFDKALGAGEAGLSMVAGMPAMIGGGLYGLGTLLSGQGLEKAAGAAERFQHSNFGAGAYTPATETGKQYASTLGELFAMPGEKAGDIGAYVGKKLGNEELGRLSAKLPVDVALNFLPLHAAYKAPLAVQKALMGKAPVKAPPNLDVINQKVQDAKARQLALQEQQRVLNYGKEAPGEVDLNYMKQRRSMDDLLAETEQTATKQTEAQLAIDERNRALEMEVKRNIADSINEQNLKALEEQNLAKQAEAQRPFVSTGEGMPSVADPRRKQGPSNVMGEMLPVERAPVGLSTGEGVPGGDIINRTPVTDSGLMGLPERPYEAPVGLSVGEQGVGSGLEPQRAQGPSNLMGEPVPAPVGLSTGEGVPGGRNITRPAGPSNLMGEAPAPFDPFGSAGASPRRPGIRGQGGGIDPDLLTLGIPKLVSKIKGITQRTPKPDTIETPTSENLINLRYDRRNKAKALGIVGDSYQQHTTVEEAIAPQNIGKDISARTTQELGAGINGAIRRNPTNGPLKAVRYWMNDASNKANAFLKQYITGDGGFNPTYQKLNEQERVLAHRITQALSESKVEYTPELAADWGLSPNLSKFLEARQAAYKAIKARGDEVNLAKGLEPVEGLDGYFPSMFDRNFVAFIGKYHTDTNGVKRFELEIPVAVKSRKEFNDALKLYKDKDIIKLGEKGRTGLRQDTGKYKAADDVAFLLNALAEKDPRYQTVLDDLKQIQMSRNKTLMNFGVHELEKKGVKGYLGSKPWLDEKTNAKEALEAEIRYFDQAAKYWSSQELLDKTQELVTHIRDKRPETAQYLDKYLNHLTGKHINASAAFVNEAVDVGVKYLGHVAATSGIKMAENPRAAFAALGSGMKAILMNVVNVPMFATQSIQLFSSGFPEAMRVASSEGMSPHTAFTSLGRGLMWRMLAPTLSDPRIASMVKMPEHMREGYKWMQQHGIDDFNEVMLSQDVLEGPLMRKTKELAFWPTTIPERLTRPTMFMWMVDMFHNAGYSGEGLYARAKQATDYTMTDYRSQEAPILYDRMGILNPETSALQKFKHNALDQWVSRGGEVKQFPLAFGTMLAFQVALGGLVGLPFMQELDELIIKPFTKKSAREHLEDAMGQDNSFIDGLASAYTNMDVGSRFALADVAPGGPLEAVFGASLSKAYKIGEAAFEYGKNLDEASLKALGAEVVPSGLKQAYNQEFYMDEDGFMLNKKGQRKYDVSRTEKQQRESLVYGLRPLSEKVQDERDWTGKQRQKKREDKITAQHQNMMKALNFGDEEGFDRAYKEYEKLGGNMALAKSIKQNMIDAKKSERERQQGKPGKSGVSIERFLEFKD